MAYQWWPGRGQLKISGKYVYDILCFGVCSGVLHSLNTSRSLLLGSLACVACSCLDVCTDSPDLNSLHLSVRRQLMSAACWVSIKYNQRLCLPNEALLSLHTLPVLLKRKTDWESGMKKNNGKNKMREGKMRWLTSSFLNLCCLFCCRLGQRGAPGGLQQAGTSAWPTATERAPILGFTKSQSPQRGGSTGVGGEESGQPAEGHWRWIQCHSSAQSGKRRDKAHLHWSEIERSEP